MISSQSAYSIVNGALRIIGVKGLGDRIEDDVANEALLLLNALRAEWSINSKNYKRYNELFIAHENKLVITLGTDANGVAGDVATRPNDLQEIVLINSTSGVGNNFKLPIRPYTDYAAIRVQNIYAMPNAAYIDDTYPQMLVWLYPGLSTGYSLRLIGSAYMSEYENISDPYIDPPEYFNPLMLNLALRLAQFYGYEVKPGLIEQANGAMKHIKMHHVKDRLGRMNNPLGNSNSFNFLAGR